MSDLLSVLRKHPTSIEHEKKHWDDFDLISVPSKFMFNQFNSSKNLSLDYHGVDKDIFDKNYQSPYKKVSVNAVWIGNNYFDHNFLKIAANAKKDWYFSYYWKHRKKYVSDRK